MIATAILGIRLVGSSSHQFELVYIQRSRMYLIATGWHVHITPVRPLRSMDTSSPRRSWMIYMHDHDISRFHTHVACFYPLPGWVGSAVILSMFNVRYPNPAHITDTVSHGHLSDHTCECICNSACLVSDGRFLCFFQFLSSPALTLR